MDCQQGARFICLASRVKPRARRGVHTLLYERHARVLYLGVSARAARARRRGGNRAAPSCAAPLSPGAGRRRLASRGGSGGGQLERTPSRARGMLRVRRRRLVRATQPKRVAVGRGTRAAHDTRRLTNRRLRRGASSGPASPLASAGAGASAAARARCRRRRAARRPPHLGGAKWRLDGHLKQAHRRRRRVARGPLPAGADAADGGLEELAVGVAPAFRSRHNSVGRSDDSSPDASAPS